MADFAQTMKDWHRMCKAMTDRKPNNACDGCPLEPYGCSPVYEAIDSYRDVDFEVVDETIRAWAAEHPEPVYPSIAKYLERLGIIIRRDGTLQADFFKAHEPMSADIAKLLGVDLVEGKNEKAD